MSFLDINNLEYLNARLTQKGRESIAKGNFVVSYFAIGDSEFTYTAPFSGLTGGSISHQSVFSPFDKDNQVKYPFKYNSNVLSGTTIYGIPVADVKVEPIRNIMGDAGFVSNSSTGTTVQSSFERINITSLTGTNTITLTGNTCGQNDYITLVLDTLNGSNKVTGITNSLVYKIVSVSGTTRTLDRNTPNFSGLTGYATIVKNYVVPPMVNTYDQQSPWKMNVVWDKRPIGALSSHRSLSGHTSSKHVSTKNFLGYTTSSGQTTNTGTTIVNTMLETITVTPEDQKCIAVLHFSENGDMNIEPDRFYKYDDYISTLTTTPITSDNTSDLNYFSVHIPFLLYHRNTTYTGATFHMGSTDKQIISKINDRQVITYRDLLDTNNYAVGKVFYNQKTIVFDDEEIVAALDYKSNRRHTLPAPQVKAIASSDPISLSTFTTGQTMYVTYMFEYTSGTTLNSLPCNYYTKITGDTVAHGVTVKFNSGEFTNLKTSLAQIIDGFVADKFSLLVQIQNTGTQPVSSSWEKIEITGVTTGGFVDPTKIAGQTFTVTNTNYNSASIFNLSTHLNGGDFTTTSGPHFGDEQPFPGSIKLIRATDIEEMRFLVNLPTGKFSTSQNPTISNGQSPFITEVALLNNNKDTLVIAKTPSPIKRTGTQVFAVKVDI